MPLGAAMMLRKMILLSCTPLSRSTCAETDGAGYQHQRAHQGGSKGPIEESHTTRPPLLALSGTPPLPAGTQASAFPIQTESLSCPPLPSQSSALSPYGLPPQPGTYSDHLARRVTGAQDRIQQQDESDMRGSTRQQKSRTVQRYQGRGNDGYMCGYSHLWLMSAGSFS